MSNYIYCAIGNKGLNCYLEVTDSGCGIDARDLSKIFDPFYTTKTPGEGTGLGLSTAYGLIKEDNGDIRVKQSVPGATTFLLEFELYNPAEDTEAE